MSTDRGYRFVTSCLGSTFEDIGALVASEREVTMGTFRAAIGPQQWAWIQRELGYDRYVPIANAYGVQYYKGVFRGVPAYFVRWSAIEYVFTSGGQVGPSLAAGVRENPTPLSRRDAALGVIARDKVLAPIGAWPWHQNERVERTQYEDIELYGKPQQVVLIWTSSETARGARTNGRLLIASNERAGYIGAGAFFVEARGRKCIDSVWVEPEYRQSTRHVRTGAPPGVDFGGILADMAKQERIDCVLRPVSGAGAAWAKRHGLRVES